MDLLIDAFSDLAEEKEAGIANANKWFTNGLVSKERHEVILKIIQRTFDLKRESLSPDQPFKENNSWCSPDSLPPSVLLDFLPSVSSNSSSLLTSPAAISLSQSTPQHVFSSVSTDNPLVDFNVSDMNDETEPEFELISAEAGDSIVATTKTEPTNEPGGNKRSKRSVVTPDSEHHRSSRQKLSTHIYDPSNADIFSVKDENAYKISDRLRNDTAAITAQDNEDFETLRSTYGKWKKVVGKGEYKDYWRYIYVNPHGVGYVFERNAVLGIDYFLNPQDALKYCALHSQPNV